MGRNHIRVLSGLKDIELVGVADVNFEIAKIVGTEFNCKFFKDYKFLIQEGIDLLNIVVPTTYHYEVAKYAIENKTNILIEKPVTKTIEEVDKLIELNKRYNVKIMVGLIERFNPPIILLKQLINENKLGKIISCFCKRVGLYPPQITDTGIIQDLAMHDIDLLNYLLGNNVKKIFASAEGINHKYEDYAVINLEFLNGIIGVIQTNWFTPHKQRKLEIIGTEGIAEIDLIEQKLTIYDKQWISEAKVFKKEPLISELKYFINCIENNKKPVVGLDEGKYALDIALRAIESAKRGEVLNL